MKGQAHRMLDRIEWDFNAVPEGELLACCYWEYARESARIHAFCDSTDSDFFPPVKTHSGIKAPDGGVSMPARRVRADSRRMRFARDLWLHALPVKLVLDRVSRKRSDPFEKAWIKLPPKFRQDVVKELEPFFAEKPALSYLPFNPCSDLRDIGLADENYRCAEFDMELGIERLRVEIAWGEFTDNQIVAAFRTWVSGNRPPGVGRENHKGIRKLKGLKNHLAWLGMLRLMNIYPYTTMESLYPDAARHYGKTHWPRARKKAGRFFHDLFPFLPASDKPIHWQTAGGRAR